MLNSLHQNSLSTQSILNPKLTEDEKVFSKGKIEAGACEEDRCRKEEDGCEGEACEEFCGWKGEVAEWHDAGK